MNIQDLYNYFKSIDSLKQNGKIDRKELKLAKSEPSIFSSVLEKGMTYEQYKTKFIEKYSEQLKPYKFEKMPEAQEWNWEQITEVWSKEKVDSMRFNVNTREGETISPELDFNNTDGKYMLAHLSFDEKTFENTPKENLPEGWNPDEIIEEGKDPGMNIRKMHELGYTGKGVLGAVIDTPIIMHKDIASSIVGYESMTNAKNIQNADYHGQAVSDIFCGDEVGSAPDAKMVYIATGGSGVGCETEEERIAQARQQEKEDKLQSLRRIIEINKEAKELNQPENKIKVVSISWGFNEGMDGYEEYKDLLKQLYDDGVFVATADFCMIDESITGAVMSRNILDKIEQSGEQNNYSNYKFVGYDTPSDPNKNLFILSGDRTVASATNPNGFRHDSKGSTSWSVPSLAGVYACALQCAEENRVEFSPQIFWQYALETGVEIKDDNGELAGKAIDAEALVKYIEEQGAVNKKFGL